MADFRAEALRRTHIVSLDLLELREVQGRIDHVQEDVEFVVGHPDGRVRTALAVMFVPDVVYPYPSDARYQGFFATGTHGLAVMAREKPAEQGQGLFFVDPVFGTLSAPVPLPGDTYGWLVSDEADAREWYCRLRSLLISEGGGIGGHWVARATYTARVDMSAEEWRRQADRIYLRRVADSGIVPVQYYEVAPPS